MKIAFDQQVFLLQEYGGISRYLCSLVRELAAMPAVTAQVFAPLHVNRNLAGLGNELSRGRALSRLPSKLLRPVMFASKLMARREMVRFKPDVVHETYYCEDDFRPNGARRVLTVYDLIHERYPDLFVNSEGTTRPKRAAANRADHVICISESTRRDLVSYCGVPEERTSVVYLGVDVDFVQAVTPSRQYHARPFLLYVGARGGYKNFERFVRAFALSQRLRQEFDLLCFGGGPLQTAERQMIADAGLGPDQVVQMGGGDEILAALYQQAAAFVYPSLYEGFGIPPLEAMAVGCPVICSNSSSLPEVVGDAAESFDPLDQEAMLAAMEAVLESPSRRSALVAAGRTRYQQFTWEKCARETEAIYRKLL
ncbi:glycosyltransferase family 4 protein [Azospira sp.]|jgi:glycosyltransferase involved in cell wall biosynthesis|uniref:glycosyltransferase family 4 protein n=1 Tax=Azospira sp. TaxID=1872671 RepID=UPI0025611543|nr:glycosyltransferase family 1 protein [Azospira sp.]MDK9689833.1 glycosyltransferase family 4 protein [Azospira sp.]